MENLIKLFFIHFVADFILQSRKMGKLKSQKVKWLLLHLIIQFICFFPFVGPTFAFLNCIIHGMIDWNIWKLYKLSVYFRDNNADEKTFKYWDDHLFYTTIGFDQFLHMTTITILFYYKVFL